MNINNYIDWSEKDAEIAQFNLNCFYLCKIQNKLLELMGEKQSRGYRIFANEERNGDPLCYGQLEKPGFYTGEVAKNLCNYKQIDVVIKELIKDSDRGLYFEKDTDLVALYCAKHPELAAASEMGAIQNNVDISQDKKLKAHIL